MTLNKANLCWVLSDGRKGHEIQSLALAARVSQHTQLHTFHLRQPWLSFAPRTIPGFKHSLVWQTAPQLAARPGLIITTGRQAAAVGKFLKQSCCPSCSHIQILNPKDRLTGYDLVLAPEHDQLEHPNVISFTGSLHPYDPQWFQSTDTKPTTPFIALVIGNPAGNYVKHHFDAELKQIRQLYLSTRLVVCGSPRLTPEAIHSIRQRLLPEDTAWFGPVDGDNPYQSILRQAQHIFVTSDSINMLNECAASAALVSVLAAQHVPSPKHRRFIDSLRKRWSGFSTQQPLSYHTPYGPDQVVQHPLFQKCLNSPTSSSAG